MIKEIQYLRALAALMVLLYHLHPQLERLGYRGYEFGSFGAGVAIFFSISGFLMVYITYDKQVSPRAFLLDRFVRVVPIYWLLTLFMATIGVIAPWLLQSSTVSGPHLIASLLFLPASHPVNGGYFPLFQPGWTLNFEIFFYVVFALFLKFHETSRYVAAIAVLVAITATIAHLQATGPISFYGRKDVYGFCFGMAVALLFRTRRDLFQQFADLRLAGWCFGVALLVMLFTEPLGIALPRLVYQELASVIILLAALLASLSTGRLDNRLLERLGDASYSLYLTHYMMLSALGQVAQRLFGREAAIPEQLVFVVVAPAVCIVASLVFYSLVERPLHRFLKAQLITTSRLVATG